MTQFSSGHQTIVIFIAALFGILNTVIALTRVVMMDNEVRVFTLHALSVAPAAALLHCYQCNSTAHPDCSLLLSNSTDFLKPCTSQDPQLQYKEPFCRKISQTIHARDGLEVVVRKCGWVRHDSSDCYRVRNLDHAETVCQCFTDGCNSAPLCSAVGTQALLLSALAALHCL